MSNLIEVDKIKVMAINPLMAALIARLSDAIEIHPITHLKDQPGVVERCERGEEDGWGIFFHLKTGGLESICDMETEVEAVAVAIDLRNRTKSAGIDLKFP